jgi:YggT family protein
VLFLRNFLEILVLVVWLLVLARVVVSWVDPAARNAVSGYIVALTEPMLAPIRRVVRPAGALDWSPFILMLGLGILLRFVSL